MKTPCTKIWKPCQHLTTTSNPVAHQTEDKKKQIITTSFFQYSLITASKIQSIAPSKGLGL